MDATSMPRQRRRSRKNHKIPPEIIEEIMLKLPVKSLVRCSKSWNSSIFNARFIRKHQTCAAFPNRHSIVINPDYGNTTSFCAIPIPSISPHKPMGIIIKPQIHDNLAFCSISSMYPNRPAVDAHDFVTQFQRKPCLYAFCDQLWCVEVQNSLFLWNPSMRIFKKLPDPLFQVQTGIGVDWYDRYADEVVYANQDAYDRYNRYEFVYGLGYDSAADDYKILKIPRKNSRCTKTELYSLRSDKWRKIKSFLPARPSFSQERCEFVDGTFYWLGVNTQPTIVSFKLSTEEYAEVAQPEYSPVINYLEEDGMEVVVVRGMLCVCVNYCRETRFVLWVMEEHGVGRSWSKKFDIQYDSSLPYFPAESLFTLKPLYFYDNGDILVKVSTDKCHLEIFMYKSEVAIPLRIASCGHCYNTSDAFIYVESLVSPVAFSSNGD